MSHCNMNKRKRKHKEYSQNLEKGNITNNDLESSIEVIYLNIIFQTNFKKYSRKESLQALINGDNYPVKFCSGQFCKKLKLKYLFVHPEGRKNN